METHHAMPLYRAEAIVIRSWRYAEADLIVSFYSRDLGKIRGIAKGARKMASRFGSSLQPFSHVMLQLFAKEGGSLHHIRSVDVLHSFFSLAGEWERLERGARLLGLVDLVTPEAEQNDELFTLLLHALHLLAGTSDPARVTTLVAIKLLALSGYEPELERCAQCGKRVNGRAILFSPSLPNLYSGFSSNILTFIIFGFITFSHINQLGFNAFWRGGGTVPGKTRRNFLK